MTSPPWLTLPERKGVQTPALQEFLASNAQDFSKAWDRCEQAHHLVELAIAGRLPVETILGACVKVSQNAWKEWTSGATDARPPQVLHGVDTWLRRESGFDDIWASWELAEALLKEVELWYQQQQGTVVASAVFNAVKSVHTLVSVARNLACPEEGHRHHNPGRYAQKNADPERASLLHKAAEAVHEATKAGSWHHSGSTPGASQEDHERYAHQQVGFLLRQHLDASQVVRALEGALG